MKKRKVSSVKLSDLNEPPLFDICTKRKITKLEFPKKFEKDTVLLKIILSNVERTIRVPLRGGKILQKFSFTLNKFNRS